MTVFAEAWREIVIVIAQWQAALFRALSDTVDRLAAGDTAAVVTALGVAFTYGVAHAMGPGHGKALIAAYAGANRLSIARGVALSVASSLLQAVVAIAIVAILALVFELSRRAVLAEALWIERASAVLTAVLGLYLIVSAMRRITAHRASLRSAEAEPGRAATSLKLAHGHSAACCGPDGHHPPFVAEAVGESPGRLQTLGLVLSIASRPCSGSIFVLLLALSQGVFAVGAAAALAIGVGTAVTVSAAALVTILLRNGALKLAARSGSTGLVVGIGAAAGIAGGVALILIAAAILNAPQSPFGPMPTT